LIDRSSDRLIACACAGHGFARWNGRGEASVERQIEGKNMKVRLATWFAAIALVAAGCGGEKEPEKDKETTTATPGVPGAPKGPEAGKGSADAPPRRAALTSKSLSPVVIHEIASENVVPSAVVIELASPIIDRQTVGSESPSVNFKITPAIDGTLIHTGISELTFTPTRPFAFDTTYQVELVAVDTVDGTIAPLPPEKWSASFKTPPFKFLGWAPSDIDLPTTRSRWTSRSPGRCCPRRRWRA